MAFPERVGQPFFQMPELSAEILHLIQGGIADSIAYEPLLARPTPARPIWVM
jgi:hypothetical protein